MKKEGLLASRMSPIELPLSNPQKDRKKGNRIPIHFDEKPSTHLAPSLTPTAIPNLLPTTRHKAQKQAKQSADSYHRPYGLPPAHASTRRGRDDREYRRSGKGDAKVRRCRGSKPRRLLLWRRVSAILARASCPGTFSQSSCVDVKDGFVDTSFCL